MKKIMTLLILCQLLCCSVKSQHITISSNAICFDSTSAVWLYKTILNAGYYQTTSEIYQNQITEKDSIIAAMERHTGLLTSGMHKRSETIQKQQHENAILKQTIATEKKRNKRMFVKGLTMGSALMVLFVMMIK